MHGAAALSNLDTALLMAPFAAFLVLALFRVDERIAGRRNPERPQEPVLRGGSRWPWQLARSGWTMLEASRRLAGQASPMGKPVCDPLANPGGARGSRIGIKLSH
jgi:hypothetical protein